jgi:hypothetical protein
MRSKNAIGRRWPAAFATLMLALPAAAAAQPALAASHGPDASGQTWAGYAVTGAGPYTSITGSWNVPAMDCAHGGGDASPWIGIDGWDNGTVEQIGIDLDCRNGQASYHPWVEMYPGPSDYFAETVHAGDTLTASVSVSGGTWTLTERDVTAGWSRTFHRRPRHAPQQASAEAIVEDVGNGQVPPVPDFGTVQFSRITVNASALASAGSAHQTTLQRGGTPLSSESALSGGEFGVTWLHH